MRDVKLNYEEVKAIAENSANPFDFLREVEYDKDSIANAVDKLTMVYNLTGLFPFLKRVWEDSNAAMKSRRFDDVDDSKGYPRYIVIIMSAYTLLKANKRETVVAISEEHEREVVAKIAGDVLKAKKDRESLFVASSKEPMSIAEMVDECEKSARVITSSEELDEFLKSAM